MSVFLVLSSLSVVFYLFVVLALYRDNHKHRCKRIQGYSNVCFDKAKDQKVSHPGGPPNPGKSISPMTCYGFW